MNTIEIISQAIKNIFTKEDDDCNLSTLKDDPLNCAQRFQQSSDLFARKTLRELSGIRLQILFRGYFYIFHILGSFSFQKRVGKNHEERYFAHLVLCDSFLFAKAKEKLFQVVDVVR